MKNPDAFARFVELVEKIRHDVEASCGCSVFKDCYLPKSVGFKLYKSQGRPRYVFAQIRPREREKLCRIYSAKEWAAKAGVDDTRDDERPNGWYGRDDGVYWDVKTVDDVRYKEIIRALGKICQVR